MLQFRTKAMDDFLTIVLDLFFLVTKIVQVMPSTTDCEERGKSWSQYEVDDVKFKTRELKSANETTALIYFVGTRSRVSR